ncbi:hypothetical protein IAU59_001602 [Kwoniella sp. CBS 9459]
MYYHPQDPDAAESIQTLFNERLERKANATHAITEFTAKMQADSLHLITAWFERKLARSKAINKLESEILVLQSEVRSIERDLRFAELERGLIMKTLEMRSELKLELEMEMEMAPTSRLKRKRNSGTRSEEVDKENGGEDIFSDPQVSMLSAKITRYREHLEEAQAHLADAESELWKMEESILNNSQEDAGGPADASTSSSMSMSMSVTTSDQLDLPDYTVALAEMLRFSTYGDIEGVLAVVDREFEKRSKATGRVIRREYHPL